MKKLLFDLYFKWKNKHLFKYVTNNIWLKSTNFEGAKTYIDVSGGKYFLIYDDEITSLDGLSNKFVFSKYIVKNIESVYRNNFFESREDYLIKTRQNKLSKI